MPSPPAPIRPLYSTSPSESGDILYKGDVGKWQRLAYALKARQAQHLTKKASYDPAAVLALCDKAFTHQADDAQIQFQTAVAPLANTTNIFGPTRGNFGVGHVLAQHHQIPQRHHVSGRDGPALWRDGAHHQHRRGARRRHRSAPSTSRPAPRSSTSTAAGTPATWATSRSLPTTKSSLLRPKRLSAPATKPGRWPPCAKAFGRTSRR